MAVEATAERIRSFVEKDDDGRVAKPNLKSNRPSVAGSLQLGRLPVDYRLANGNAKPVCSVVRRRSPD